MAKYTYDANVAKQQADLNKKGAGLKVDGFLGPLTQSAITKYASPAPVNNSNIDSTGTALVPNAGSYKTVSPAIITSKSATTDLNKIKQSVTEANTGMTAQAQRIADEKAKMDLEKSTAETARIAQEQKDKELALKESALTDGEDTTDYTIPDKTSDELKLEQAQEAYFKEAEIASNAIRNIQNGTVPLSAGEKAQLSGLEQAYKALIEEQKLTNISATGTANIRGYQTGAAEYDPSFQVKTIGTIVTAGINKIADLNTKMASAVAEMTQGFKDNKISSIKDSWDIYSEASKERTKSITDTITRANDKIKEIREEKAKQEKAYFDEVTKPIQELAKTAGNLGASPEVINKILNSPDLSSAYESAGSYAGGGTGIIGEYNFYKAQAEATGQVPMSFNAYQTEDANRKRSIAAAGVGGTSGMNSKQVAIFNSLVDKQNKSPLIAANDRAGVLKDVTSALKKDPTNAALQVSFIYSMIQALDTYQSAVREGEIGLLASTQGVGDKITNILPKVQGGNPLSENKINEYINVANLLTSSIEKAAQKKKDAFTAQANIAGVGGAFNEYQTALGEVGGGANDLVKTETEAKNVVDEFYPTAPEDVQNAIEVLIEKGKNNLAILEYLHSKNLIQ